MWFLFLDKKKVNKKERKHNFFLHPIKGCYFIQHKGIEIGKDRDNWVLIVGILIKKRKKSPLYILIVT